MKKYYADKTCLNVLRVVMFLATVGLIFVDYYFLYIFPMIMWIILIVFATAYVAIALIWLQTQNLF